ncbi:hypothetical protein D929_00101 [Enterococcus faecalis 02-MB-P-10]|uniref:hypothetical protein n=1 Tax=Enterococcus faecalis TaxID=1351 RepID=UPI000352A6D8|nr:hypothetical protein [Enterococcus faecalis]EPH77371.1 hypothetical protein D929_00101 [Enterococcus faecalis 02-MB-P-10]
MREENSIRKEMIKQSRIELLALMSLDDNWYKNEDSELYKKIIICSRTIRELSSDRKKAQIDKDEYIKLREFGYTYYDIADYYAIPLSRLNRWRLDNDMSEY